MTKKLVVPVVIAAVLLALVVVLGASPTRTIAQDTPPEPNAELDGAYLCTIKEIAIFPDRMHVMCDTANVIKYFALPTDAVHALQTNRFLTILNTAFAINQQVYVYFDDVTSHNPPGCQTGNCRLLVALIMDKP